MKDEIFSSLEKASLKIFPEFAGNFQVTKPQDSLHGDWSSNIALIMAKEMKKNPREIAIEIISALEGLDYSEKVEVAGAGFINIYLKEDLFFNQIKNYALRDFNGLLVEKEPKKNSFGICFQQSNWSHPCRTWKICGLWFSFSKSIEGSGK